MSRSPEAKERDRLAAITRRAARKAGTAPVNGIPASILDAPVASSPMYNDPPGSEPVMPKTPRPLRRSERAAKRLKKEAAEAPASPAKARGGARKGAGAPAGPTTRMRVITFKGTDAHYAAFMAAGSGAWLRGVLDAGVAAKHIKVPK